MCLRVLVSEIGLVTIAALQIVPPQEGWHWAAPKHEQHPSQEVVASEVSPHEGLSGRASPSTAVTEVLLQLVVVPIGGTENSESRRQWQPSPSRSCATPIVVFPIEHTSSQGGTPQRVPRVVAPPIFLVQKYPSAVVLTGRISRVPTKVSRRVRSSHLWFWESGSLPRTLPERSLACQPQTLSSTLI